METSKFKFASKIDGLEISVLTIAPDQPPKAIVQLVHGMCEYKERYLDFMNFLAEQGFACIIHDHRGHGESIKDIKDLGFMYEGGAIGLVEDTREVTNIAKKRYGEDIPFYLLGHSMGSMIVRCYIKRYDDSIDKLVVVGSPSKPSGSGMGLAIAKASGKIKGADKKLKLLDFLAMEMTYEQRFKKEKLVHAWVNSDREKVIEYNNDPFCNYTFTINGYSNLIKITVDTYSKKGWKLANKDLPIAFFSGEDDPCAVSPAKFEESAQFLRDLGYTSVKAKMYQGMRHEILNEPEHLGPYNDILSFLNE